MIRKCVWQLFCPLLHIKSLCDSSSLVTHYLIAKEQFLNHLFVFLVWVLDLIKEVLSLDNEIRKLAEELFQQKSVLIMGRGYNYATCLEGALVSKDHNSNQLCLYCCEC